MLSKNISVLWFLMTLPSFLAHPDGQRSQMDASVRGSSFGLENFLFQPYDNPQVKNAVRIVKTKRVRPAANQRTPAADRGQTYGLENLSAQLYEANRLKLTPTKPSQEHTKKGPIEPAAESTRIKENFVVKPETALEVTQEPETSTQESATERIRKRIMMRRRRKRPPNPIQAEGNGEIIGNAIPKPVRIPIYPQAPKVIVRTKLADQGAAGRVQPVGVKSVTISQKENDGTGHTISGEEEPPSTDVGETSTVTTAAGKPSPVNLKAFLKQQTETLSLSELLQTQNLSLADLLRGNKDASSILKAKQASTTTTTTTTTTAAGSRRKQIDRTEPQQVKELPREVEIIEVTTSRVSYKGFQPKIPRTKISNHANNKAVVDEGTQDETAKATKRPPASDTSGVDPLNRLNELRLKLRNFHKKTSPSVIQVEATHAPTIRDETIELVSAPPKAADAPLHKKNRIAFKSTSNPELSPMPPNKVKPEPETLKRPERLSNWTNRLPSIKRIPQGRPKPSRISILTEDSNESTGNDEEVNVTTEIIAASEEERKPEPKDELIELLKSGQNADKLQKILFSRNMTIQELLDNREKPPLQVNISALFSSQQKQAPTSSGPTLFDSLPDFEVTDTDPPSAGVYDEPEAEESAPVIAKVQLVPSREAKQYEFPISEKGVSQLSMHPDDLTADTSNAEESTLWKLSEKSMYYGSSYGYGKFAAAQQTEKPEKVRSRDFSEEDIILLETIRRNQETNRKFKLNYGDFVREEEEPDAQDIEKSYIPPAVKSAIIASGVVMGIALFVFIAIFAACGWKQRQIRLKGSSHGLGETLAKRKMEKSKRTLSPASFKDTQSYKKTIDFGDETSDSGTSNTSSYLWSTLKNTFTSRASTLKSRLEKDEKLREDKVTLRRNESRRKETRLDDTPIGDEIYTVKKIDRDRNVINTSFNFRRSPSNDNVNHFNECVHGY